jgi:hypothetical protein
VAQDACIEQADCGQRDRQGGYWLPLADAGAQGLSMALPSDTADIKTDAEPLRGRSTQNGGYRHCRGNGVATIFDHLPGSKRVQGSIASHWGGFLNTYSSQTGRHEWRLRISEIDRRTSWCGLKRLPEGHSALSTMGARPSTLLKPVVMAGSERRI